MAYTDDFDLDLQGIELDSFVNANVTKDGEREAYVSPNAATNYITCRCTFCC